MSGPPGDELPPWDHDEDLISRARTLGQPRARVVAWPPPGAPPVAIVVGRGGRSPAEVHLEAARADGVPILRRRGGGCAVVLDPGNVVVSLAWPLPGVGGITSAFALISAWVVDALDRCGAPGVVREGVSDLALAGRKIGGACLWRTQGLVYYAATLLVAPDVELIERYLPHPPREPAWRGARAHRAFLGRLGPLPVSTTAADFAARLAATLDPAALAQP